MILRYNRNIANYNGIIRFFIIYNYFLYNIGPKYTMIFRAYVIVYYALPINNWCNNRSFFARHRTFSGS